MARSTKRIKTIWKTRLRRRRMPRWKLTRLPRKIRRRRFDANHRERIFQFEEASAHLRSIPQRRTRFSAHFYASRLSRTAAPVSCGVVSLRESFAHHALAAGRGVRAALRYFAGSADRRD